MKEATWLDMRLCRHWLPKQSAGSLRYVVKMTPMMTGVMATALRNLLRKTVMLMKTDNSLAAPKRQRTVLTLTNSVARCFGRAYSSVSRPTLSRLHTLRKAMAAREM